MYGMFNGAKSFNQNLDSWKVNKRTETSGMFENSPLESNPPRWHDASKRHDSPNKTGHKYRPQNRDELVKLLWDESIKLDSIDVSMVTDMSFLFTDAFSADCDVLAEYEGFAPYIQNCKNAANARKDLSGLETWDVSNVIDMSGMFYVAESFNEPLESWNVSNVIDMSGMFWGATSFNQPLNSWNVSKVKDMKSMFDYAKSFNQPLDKWNVGRVTNMNFMFNGADFFNQNLNSWKINKGANTAYVFKGSPLESKPPKWYKNSRNLKDRLWDVTQKIQALESKKQGI